MLNKNPTTQTPLLTFNEFIQAAKASLYLSIDTEGNGRDIRGPSPDGYTTGISLAFGFQDTTLADYWGFKHKTRNNAGDRELGELAELIQTHPRVIFHNAKHDLLSLQDLGINRTGPFYDTMLMQHFINENFNAYGLDALSRLHGGNPKLKPQRMTDIINAFGWDYVPGDMMWEYAANDAEITHELFNKLYPEFCTQGFDGELWDWEQKFIRLLIKMEHHGIRIDTDFCEKEALIGEERMEEIVKDLNGRKPSSPLDLKSLLLDELGLPIVKRTDKGKPSFDKHAMAVYDDLLSRQANKTAQLILEYRGWQKTVSSNYRPYLALLSNDGRLRPNYKLHGTVTGRMSCERPNLQQIPKTGEKRWNGHLKQAFIPAEGFRLYGFDYSQLELRLASAYANEQAFITVCEEGRDLFTEMAERLSWKRDDGKTFTYATLYGGGDQRISELFGVNKGRARELRKEWFGQFPNFEKIIKQCEHTVKQRGYIKLWTGRRRHFINRYDDAHKGFNAAIQGGGAEIVKRSMIRIDEAGLNNQECRLLLNIHDELVVEIQEGKEQEYIPEIKNIMEDVRDVNGNPMPIKFAVDSKTWGEK